MLQLLSSDIAQRDIMLPNWFSSPIQRQDAPASWKPEVDLPALACQAAVEIDNVILGRAVTFDAVAQLAALLETKVMEHPSGATQPATIDPATIVVMRRAINDAIHLTSPMTNVQELVVETDKIRQRMNAIQQLASVKGDMSTLTEMRSFCLALSKRAAAQQQRLASWESPRMGKI